MMIFIEKCNQNKKITPDAPKNESGLIQIITEMVRMGKSIHHTWVDFLISDVL